MTNQKITVGILFGGKSAEHEVSLQSAKNIFEALDQEKYHPVLIGIDKSGKWLLCDNSNFLLHANDPKLIQLNPDGDHVALVPQSNGQLFNLTRSINSEKIDVVFPILHGTFGEDGTVQGSLKLANIPFVGASILGSAVGMDKDVMKRLLRDAGIPIGKFISLDSEDTIPGYTAVTEKVGSPCFVKPANMGSSVGVYKVGSENEYTAAVKNAFQYDHKILIEEYIQGREIECSVLGNHHPIASIPGEVSATHDFYSYEAKYLDEAGAILTIPADISNETAKKIQELAIKTFQVLSCEGFGRVDSFLKSNGEILVNEINTIPGFTKISMYPKLWAATGISYSELIDRLIQLALERFQKEQKLQTNYTN